MPRPDALTIMRTLRRNEAEVARQQVAIALDCQRMAEAELASATEALAIEQRHSEQQLYAVWLPAAERKISSLRKEVERRTCQLHDSLDALTSARLAEQIIDDEMKRRTLALRREKVRKEQQFLDDVKGVDRQI